LGILDISVYLSATIGVMDSLEIEGKEYISAKRAAREHSYTMDYIGQLIRGGKLVGKKVGRAWYVEQDSLTSYLNSLLKAEVGKVDDAPTQLTKPAEIVAPVQPEPVAEVATAPVLSTASLIEESDLQQPAAAVEVPMTTNRSQAPVERLVYHYPMLNYVSADAKEEELIPTLQATQTQSIPINRKVETVATPTIEERWAAPQAPQVTKKPAAIGERVSYLPAIRFPSLAPMAIGGSTALLFLALLGATAFFSKTIQYESATASVTSSFTYDSIFTESR
jgi:hypothetical protein